MAKIVTCDRYTLINGDCLDYMPALPGGIQADAVIADPPYGTTACKWDSVIPLDQMWAGIRAAVKPGGAIVLFAGQPFTSALVMSLPEWYRHSWVWEKRWGANYLNAKRAPMKVHEDIVVFCDRQPLYNPQKVKASPYRRKRVGHGWHIRDKSQAGYVTDTDERFPRSVIYFDFDDRRGLHPTQKPVQLMAYLIKTYTNPGDTVLDFVMGSGTTGIAAMHTGRKFVGIEQDREYFEIARRDIERARIQAAGGMANVVGRLTDADNLPLFNDDGD